MDLHDLRFGDYVIREERSEGRWIGEALHIRAIKYLNTGFPAREWVDITMPHHDIQYRPDQIVDAIIVQDRQAQMLMKSSRSSRPDRSPAIVNNIVRPGRTRHIYRSVGPSPVDQKGEHRVTPFLTWR